MGRPRSWRRTVIVGAGPVGALAALYAANRGDEVNIYELRSDLRETNESPLNFTRSINLALSERGIQALRSGGHDDLLAKILDMTIPMYGRMIHSVKSQQIHPYDVHGRYQRSVDRNELNKLLLNKLDTLPNVHIHFEYKLTGADLKAKKAWLEDQSTVKQDEQTRPKEIEIDYDLLIGADGAHSAVRYHMMKFTRMDYQQYYIDSLWCEFTISPDPLAATHAKSSIAGAYVNAHPSSITDVGYKLPVNYLHIWPAGTSVFIALPSPGGFFVCTLFGPAELFARLEASTHRSSDQSDNGKSFLSIFDELFPGVTSLIPPEDLIAQFRQNPHLPLISVKCAPHHYADNAVIVGDSANAMVPFHGQGMNAGFESVRKLWECIDDAKDSSEGWHDWMFDGLQAYSTVRTVDTHAIADLALGNYYEMASGVKNRSYKIRKWIEEFLHVHFPKLGWQTQYSRVSFSNERYSQVVQKSKQQKAILTMALNAAATGVLGGIAYFVYRFTTLGHRFRTWT